jgi:hypothetical protein
MLQAALCVFADAARAVVPALRPRAAGLCGSPELLVVAGLTQAKVAVSPASDVNHRRVSAGLEAVAMLGRLRKARPLEGLSMKTRTRRNRLLRFAAASLRSKRSSKEDLGQSRDDVEPAEGDRLSARERVVAVADALSHRPRGLR